MIHPDTEGASNVAGASFLLDSSTCMPTSSSGTRTAYLVSPASLILSPTRRAEDG
ncbi:unnamed protein product, partial [Amoebophrya sp. A25]|eukprot:GSA25T00004230001.1